MRRTGSEEIGEQPSGGFDCRRFFLRPPHQPSNGKNCHGRPHRSKVPISLVKSRAEALDFIRDDAGPLLPGFLIDVLPSSPSARSGEQLRRHECPGHGVWPPSAWSPTTTASWAAGIETDEDYHYRINLKLQSQSGVNEAALRFALLQVPGIQDVVFDRHAGTFHVYVYSMAPQVAASLLDMVQQAINDNVAYPLTGLSVAPALVAISRTTTQIR